MLPVVTTVDEDTAGRDDRWLRRLLMKGGCKIETKVGGNHSGGSYTARRLKMEKSKYVPSVERTSEDIVGDGFRRLCNAWVKAIDNEHSATRPSGLTPLESEDEEDVCSLVTTVVEEDPSFFTGGGFQVSRSPLGILSG